MTQPFQSRYLPKRKENISPYKDLHMNVYSRVILICYKIFILIAKTGNIQAVHQNEWISKLVYS